MDLQTLMFVRIGFSLRFSRRRRHGVAAGRRGVNGCWLAVINRCILGTPNWPIPPALLFSNLQGAASS